ncbi:hypothetical protein MLD38_032735 [Melastoma candidum]|uniref:Uncharacterized protein n=1 Tax=Melastoma candidum TaxID=119954 RepID=A0ACB9M4K2_9MYRT|nr:hypothetical protein MLD38_032735 [Melastoma candidum]
MFETSVEGRETTTAVDEALSFSTFIALIKLPVPESVASSLPSAEGSQDVLHEDPTDFGSNKAIFSFFSSFPSFSLDGFSTLVCARPCLSGFGTSASSAASDFKLSTFLL